MKKIIAIDGPSGTGKSTIAKELSQKFNLNYVDTGAVYRSIAFAISQSYIDINNINGIIQKAAQLSSSISFDFKNGIHKTYLNETDISNSIRTQEISMLASKISAIPELRSILLSTQRDIANNTKKIATVLDGRDIGTIVFPNADLKIFLTASADIRARRRYNELLIKNQQVDYNEVYQETVQRDKQDTEREIAPLRKAENAIEVNTDNLNIENVVKYVSALYKEIIK